jgi:vacuolar-type H+-ATPase subunit I/STV1
MNSGDAEALIAGLMIFGGAMVAGLVDLTIGLLILVLGVLFLGITVVRHRKDVVPKRKVSYDRGSKSDHFSYGFLYIGIFLFFLGLLLTWWFYTNPYNPNEYLPAGYEWSSDFVTQGANSFEALMYYASPPLMVIIGLAAIYMDVHEYRIWKKSKR